MCVFAQKLLKLKKRSPQIFHVEPIIFVYITIYLIDMTKKRKLNSKNPRYLKVDDNAPKILKKKLMCNAKIRGYGGVDTGRTAAVYGVWYEN